MIREVARHPAGDLLSEENSMRPRRFPSIPAAAKAPVAVGTDPDTCSLGEACRRLGISRTLGGRLAREGAELCAGVRILRFGSPTSDRPVYRVSIAQLDAVLAAPQAG